MLIEYCADDEEFDKLTPWLKNCEIINWCNPEEGYFIIETQDHRVTTMLGLMGIEFYVINTDLSWREYSSGAAPSMTQREYNSHSEPNGDL